MVFIGIVEGESEGVDDGGIEFVWSDISDVCGGVTIGLEFLKSFKV